MTPARLETTPLHLGRGGQVVPLTPVTGPDWYDAYERAHGGDGADGRLITQWTFDAPWTGWEMHPAGAEVVLVTAGTMTLIQQWPDGRETATTLGAGDYAVNPPGVWHTADVAGSATALFITTGLGTEARPR